MLLFSSHRRLYFTVLISSIISGMAVVYAPFHAVSSTSPDLNVVIYFCIYIILAILISFVLRKKINTTNCDIYLFLSSLFRLLLALVMIATLFFKEFSAWAYMIIMAICFSSYDSVYRISLPLIIRNVAEKDGLQRVSSNSSMLRQLGYVIGSSAAGFILFIDIIYAAILIMLLTMCVSGILFKKPVFHKISHSPIETQRGIVGILKKENVTYEFFTLLVILSIGFIIPTTIAYLIVEVKNHSSKELGIGEAIFSIGSFLGAYAFRNNTSSIQDIGVILILSLSLLFLSHMNLYAIYVSLFSIGFLIQISISISTKLQLILSDETVGNVISSVYLLGTIFSSIFLIFNFSLGGISPHRIYIISSISMFLMALALTLREYRGE